MSSSVRRVCVMETTSPPAAAHPVEDAVLALRRGVGVRIIVSPTCSILEVRSRRAAIWVSLALTRSATISTLAAGNQVIHMADAPDLAVVQDRDAVADKLHVGELMRGQEDRPAFLFQPQDQVADVAVRDRVKARRRLVEEQQLGIVDERLRDADALEHAFGERAQRLLAGSLQADHLQQLVHALLLDRAGQAEQAAVEADHFRSGHMLIEVGRLGQVGDLLLDINVAGGLAQNQDLARRREDQAQQSLDGRGLARAVGAEEAENLALVDIQADVVDGGDLFVLLDQVLDLDGFGVAAAGPVRGPDVVRRRGRRRGGGCGGVCHVRDCVPFV